MTDPTDTPSSSDAATDDDLRGTRPGIVSSRDFEPVGGDEPSAVPGTSSAVPTAASPSRPTDPARTASRRSASRTIGTGLLVLLLGFGGGVGGWWVGEHVLNDDSSGATGTGATFQPTNDSASSSTKSSGSRSNDDAEVRTPQEIYAAMSPAVAHIDSRIVKTTTDFFGQQSEQEGEGTGSGFIIDSKGHIVTNAHVIQDAKSITVSLGKDNVTVPAKVVGQDPSSDIAVLRFDPDAKALDGVELAVAEFGDSSKLTVGDPVAAIGNPFGLDRTLTTGVVSALQRNIPALNDFSISDVIQIDAAVNPGNSGGPLLDSAGNVIGVNSQISTQGGGFDGIAFAVPSNTVAKVAKQLVKSGSIDYAWLGVQGGELTSELAEQLDVKLDHGVYLGEVTSGGPADKAGLKGGRQLRDLSTGDTVVQGGDVLLSFDGEKLTSMSQLGALVSAREPGDEVKVEYVRDGKRETTTVTLGERPASSSSDDESDGNGGN